MSIFNTHKVFPMTRTDLENKGIELEFRELYEYMWVILPIL